MTRPTSTRGPWTLIEGSVERIGDNGLWFREDEADQDIFIPFSQIVDADYVKEEDPSIKVTDWLLQKLSEEGKR